jgi:hypothetical protein
MSLHGKPLNKRLPNAYDEPKQWASIAERLNVLLSNNPVSNIVC